MHSTRFVLALLVCVAVGGHSFAQQKGRKVAFLVGVGEFEFKLPDLKGSPQKDVAELGAVLKAGGFEVVTLTDKQATKDNVEGQFRRVVDGDAAKKVAPLTKGDVLLVALCTHGFTLPPAAGKPPAPFLAAHDSKAGQPNTMISLNGLLEAHKDSAATHLYLIDACREVVDENRGVGPRSVTLGNDTAILFACKDGQLSTQSEKVGGHGLFTFAVLQAMKGGRAEDWDGLVTEVKRTFKTDQFKSILDGKPQVPVDARGQLGVTELIAKSGEPPPPPPPASTMKARVKPYSGADVVYTEAAREGGKNLGVPYLEKDDVVTIEETIGTRCRITWTDRRGKTQEGWMNQSDLRIEK